MTANVNYKGLHLATRERANARISGTFNVGPSTRQEMELPKQWVVVNFTYSLGIAPWLYCDFCTEERAFHMINDRPFQQTSMKRSLSSVTVQQVAGRCCSGLVHDLSRGPDGWCDLQHSSSTSVSRTSSRSIISTSTSSSSCHWLTV